MAEPEFDELQWRIRSSQNAVPHQTIEQFAEDNQMIKQLYGSLLSENFYGMSVDPRWVKPVHKALHFLTHYTIYTGANLRVKGITMRYRRAPPEFDIAWHLNQPQTIMIDVLHTIMMMEFTKHAQT
jgi:hypothetical protein